jgi:Fe-S-cluster containining protein
MTTPTRISLRLLDEELSFLPTTPDRASLVDVLPAARQLTDQATSVILDHFRAIGRPPSCRAGCGACCRQLVAISLPEAVDLRDMVNSLPTERQAIIRQRFDSALQRLLEAGLLEDEEPGQRTLMAEEQATPEDTIHQLSSNYFHLGIACPFLENESCSIYERRPAVCREYHVVSPAEHCSNPDVYEVHRVESTIGMTNALAKTTHRFSGERPRTIPLLLALEWAERYSSPLRRKHSGAELLSVLVGELQEAD